jgi:hypothetical protein
MRSKNLRERPWKEEDVIIDVLLLRVRLNPVMGRNFDWTRLEAGTGASRSETIVALTSTAATEESVALQCLWSGKKKRDESQEKGSLLYVLSSHILILFCRTFRFVPLAALQDVER